MKVILLETVKRIWAISYIIELKRGSDRNLLIDKKITLYACKQIRKDIDTIKSGLS